jgi:hypothetical protein
VDRHLGKRSPRIHPATATLAHYRDTDPTLAATAPSSWTLEGTASLRWGTLGNTTAGDCAVAAALHAEMAWRASAGESVTFTDEQALVIYSGLTGYDPQTGADDTGLVETDVLSWWRSHQLGDSQILGWAAVDVNDPALVEFADAAFIFGGLYLGFAMPLTARSQPAVWDVVTGAGAMAYPGSWGGHAVYVVDRTTRGTWRGISWGRVVEITDRFMTTYADEAYAIVSPDEFGISGSDWQGWHTTDLLADLSAIPPVAA